jgi:siroheme synthase
VLVNGTRPNQQVTLTTLATLADRVEAIDRAAPTLLVVGDVVSLAGTLQWFSADGVDEEAASKTAS